MDKSEGSVRSTLIWERPSPQKKSKVAKAADATPEELSDLKRDGDLYVDFNIPWRLNLSANFLYSNTGIRKDTTFTINMSGDVNLTPKWKVGYTTGYDFKQMDFSYTSLSLYRDLHLLGDVADVDSIWRPEEL